MRRRVAIKVLKAGMDTRQVLARFEAESQALAMMDHPNIARVFDSGETPEGRPFFVMELVRGTPITTYCDREELDTRTRLGLFVQVCRAVQHAHQKGVIHRDLKPGNVLITIPDGAEPVPKVIDFGVAKAVETPLTDKTLFTRFEQMIGTPAYMSPEQAGTEAPTDIDTRTDIYALGVLLYELLTGTTPIEAETLQQAAFDEVRRILREEEAPRPSARLSSLEQDRLTNVAHQRHTEPATLGKQVRGDLDWIVMCSIEKDRRRRYETANALAKDVERHLADEPVSAGPPTATYRLQKFTHRHKAALVVAAAMLLLLVAGIAASTWQAVRATAEKRRAIEAEALAEERLMESEAISSFLTNMFENFKPGEEEGGRNITVVETLKTAERKLAEDKEISPERRAILQKTIGEVYQALGLYSDAIPLLEEVLRFFDDTHDPEHPDTLKAMHSLANSYDTVARRDEALEMREEVLALHRKVFGPEHPDTLKAIYNLAISYAEVGRRDEALEMQEKVLALSRKVLGPEHPDTINARYGLARSYRKTGRNDEALAMLEEVLALSRKVLGPEHPDTLASMFALASSYADADRLDEAMKMREQVLALRRKVLGPEHPNTINAIHNLALSYRNAGRRDEALTMFEKAFSHYQKVLGPGHYNTRATRSKALQNNKLPYSVTFGDGSRSSNLRGNCCA